MLYLDEKLRQYFADDQPLFDQLMQLQGQVFRELEGRKTMRVIIGDKPYFIKQHRGVGYREILKNVSQLRWPVVSARNEWRAIERLHALDIKVPKVVGYGERGVNPAAKESFILMEEVAPAISLEDLTRDWRDKKPDIKFKRMLINRLANITRIMHAAGINHRDLYICHFLMIIRDEMRAVPEDIELFLIDLHRAQIRQYPVVRWVIKDLAGLYFSSMDAGITTNDLYRFMKTYSQKSLREIFSDRTRKHLWGRVQDRAEQLYHDHAE